MNQFKAKLEKNNNDSYKKVLKSVKDFIDEGDSMHDLNPKETEEFVKIVISSLALSNIKK